MDYKLEYYNSSVQATLNAWPVGIRANFRGITIRMIEHGPHLGFPHTRAMSDGPFEIRAKAALDSFLQARKEAGLTQDEIARRMGTTRSAVSRLESSFGNDKHSPSFATLRKYAKACGKKLEIKLIG